MFPELNSQYRTFIDNDIVRLDLSGVGTAVIDIGQKSEDIDPEGIAEDVLSRVLGALPKTGFAVSVIVPLYNEEEILGALVAEFVEQFSRFPFQTEFLLCENGSQDQTRYIAATLAEEHVNVRLVTISEPSYGEAIKLGIQEASADLIIVFNADLWCTRFFLDSVLLLQNGYDIVIGSKRLVPTSDKRPLLRRMITASFNLLLKAVFGLRGTDTHGMKAMRRSSVLGVLARCLTKKEVFDTELVLRAERADLRICEIPTEVRDNRPARLSLLSRVPSTVRDLWTIKTTI